MDSRKEILGDNSIEDVSWLCSLSESELDLLISLKMLVLQRARVVGHENLAKKFDLKMLRALGFILMEHLKGQMKDLSLPNLNGSAAYMDACNLLKCNLDETMSIEEIKACIGTESKKRRKKK